MRSLRSMTPRFGSDRPWKARVTDSCYTRFSRPVPLRAGEHELVVFYQPSLLKPFLLILGVSLFALCGWLLWQPQAVPLENSLTNRIANRVHDSPLSE